MCGHWLLLGQAYSLFAGKEVARALATLDLSGCGLNQDLDGLSAEVLKILQEWEAKFTSQYPSMAQVLVISLHSLHHLI